MSARNNALKRFMRKDKAVVKPPKTFDITLGDAIAKLNFSDDEIKRLGELTAKHRSGLAHATLGNQVWYRERQLRDLFPRIQGVSADYVVVDEATDMGSPNGEQA